MKFIVNSKLLLAALKSVAPIAPKETTIPILRSLLLELKSGVLRLTATNLNETAVRIIPVQDGSSGAITCPVDKLLHLIESFSPCNLSFRTTEQHLIVNAGSGEYKIMSDKADEFPHITREEYSGKISCSAKEFAAHLSTVGFAVSTDELRTTLMGVLFEIRENALYLVATDGHRLARVINRNIDVIDGKKELQAIVPIRAIAFIAKIAKEEETVEMSFGESAIRFRVGELTLYSKLIAGFYPNYERVLPKECNLFVSALDIDELQSMITRANIIADEMTHRIQIVFAEKEMEVKAITSEGEAQEHISVSYKTETQTLTVCCNAGYFIQILKHLPAERIDLRFKDAGSAMLFVPSVANANSETMMMLMPIKMENQ